MKAFPHIYSFYDLVLSDPAKYRQFECDKGLVTEFNCPLEDRFQPLWSQHNYVLFVLEGKKIWHTPAGAFELTPGVCTFVRKGAAIVEQFFDSKFCIIGFFLPDSFVCETLRTLPRSSFPVSTDHPPISRVEMDDTLMAYLQSIVPYFARMQPPEKTLLELKFRELLLNIAGNPRNREVLAYFCSLLHEPSGAASLRVIMEDNFCFNLTLEQYAQLCNRSLSAFKRDFQKIFQATPGKWLLAKRLDYARTLLSNTEKTVSEVAFESGFENLSHFSRVFRERFSMSPAALRQQPAF